MPGSRAGAWRALGVGSSLAFASALTGLALLCGCPRGEAHEDPPPVTTGTSRTGTLQTGALATGALQTGTLPTGTLAPASAPPSAPPPPGAPAADRPSAKARRPPGADPAQWQRIFDTYGTLLDLEDILADHHHRHPERTALVELGRTTEGRPVRALLLADDPAAARARPAILLNGAHHGDEPLSSAIVLDAVETLLAGAGRDPRIDRYLHEFAIWCVPLVNPDGFAAFMVDFGAGRKNGRETRPGTADKSLRNRGVDLNRNYPFRWGALGERGSRSDPASRFFRGPAPASEPETRAMMALSDRERFVASISYHIGTVALLAPYTIEGVDNPSPNEAWLVAEDVARAMPPNPDKPLRVRKNLYPVDGTDQDYHRGTFGTVALLFEAASRSWETPALKEKTLAAIRPSWAALLDRYLDGPSIEGHVRDAQGRPLSAEVRVVEAHPLDPAKSGPHSGERWTTRCPDGFFGRFLPGFGRFTVRVTPEGGSPVEAVVDVERGKGRVAIDLVADAPSAAACPAAAR